MSINSDTNPMKLLTTGPKTGTEDVDNPSNHLFDEESGNIKVRRNSSPALPRLGREKIRKLSVCLSSDGVNCDPRVLTLATAVFCLLILCLFIVQVKGIPFYNVSDQIKLDTGRNQPQPIVYFYDKTLLVSPAPTSPLPYFQRLQQRPEDWEHLSSIVGNKQKLRFSVGRSERISSSPKVSNVINNHIVILGRPTFCEDGEGMENAEEIDQIFSEATHVTLFEMSNCHRYIDLILNSWKFPKVRQIKLQRMAINKKEFAGLTNFIDRHNKTLTLVEIDECFLCSSLDCDVGMINYPEHDDFEIVVTRRRDQPDWI